MDFYYTNVEKNAAFVIYNYIFMLYDINNNPSNNCVPREIRENCTDTLMIYNLESPGQKYLVISMLSL